MKVAIRKGTLLKDLSIWDKYDFVNKGITIKKLIPNGRGSYDKIDYFHKRAYITEPPYNYSIVEVNTDDRDIEYSDFDYIDGRFVFNEAKRSERVLKKRNDAVKKQYLAEIDALIKWFGDYDKKVSEHERCLRLGAPCHHNIVELDNEAAQKQTRLRLLRELTSAM